jgi:hypothetical protein
LISGEHLVGAPVTFNVRHHRPVASVFAPIPQMVVDLMQHRH